MGRNIYSIAFLVTLGVLVVYGRQVTSTKDDDWHILLQHKSGSKINAQESTALDNILTTYNAQNGLTVDTFTNLVEDTFEFEESRDLIDIEGGGITYNKLVYVLQKLATILDNFISDDDKNMLFDIFGDQYKPETESECLAQIIFYTMDPQKSNVISFDEFKDQIVNSWWTELDVKNVGSVTNNEFKNLFVDTENWDQFKDQIIYQQSGTTYYDGKAIYSTLKNSNAEDIESVQLTMIPHQFDQQIRDYDDGVNTPYTTSDIMAIPPIVVAGAWFVARWTVRVAVGAAITAIGAKPCY